MQVTDARQFLLLGIKQVNSGIHARQQRYSHGDRRRIGGDRGVIDCAAIDVCDSGAAVAVIASSLPGLRGGDGSGTLLFELRPVGVVEEDAMAEAVVVAIVLGLIVYLAWLLWCFVYAVWSQR